jgi:hypothetical protein
VTLGDMRKATKNLDDDFKIIVDLFERIPDEQLKKMSYPYPYYRTEMDFEFNDVGYSDKEACFGVYQKTEE